MATNGTIGGRWPRRPQEPIEPFLFRGAYTIEKDDPHQGINNNHAGQIVTIYWR